MLPGRFIWLKKKIDNTLPSACFPLSLHLKETPCFWKARRPCFSLAPEANLPQINPWYENEVSERQKGGHTRLNFYFEDFRILKWALAYNLRLTKQQNGREIVFFRLSVFQHLINKVFLALQVPIRFPPLAPWRALIYTPPLKVINVIVRGKKRMWIGNNCIRE